MQRGHTPVKLGYCDVGSGALQRAEGVYSEGQPSPQKPHYASNWGLFVLENCSLQTVAANSAHWHIIGINIALSASVKFVRLGLTANWLCRFCCCSGNINFVVFSFVLWKCFPSSVCNHLKHSNCFCIHIWGVTKKVHGRFLFVLLWNNATITIHILLLQYVPTLQDNFLNN